jgi:Rrf2 family protein
MKINTKIRYGLRMVAMIAARGEVINTTELGKAMQVSSKYLRKLAGPLEKAGILKSEQGVYGGYLLNKPPPEIPLKMIWDAFNEKLTLVDCVSSKICPMNEECLTRPIWERLDRVIEREFMNITIAEILAQGKNKNPV